MVIPTIITSGLGGVALQAGWPEVSVALLGLYGTFAVLLGTLWLGEWVGGLVRRLSVSGARASGLVAVGVVGPVLSPDHQSNQQHDQQQSAQQQVDTTHGVFPSLFNLVAMMYVPRKRISPSTNDLTRKRSGDTNWPISNDAATILPRPYSAVANPLRWRSSNLMPNVIVARGAVPVNAVPAATPGASGKGSDAGSIAPPLLRVLGGLAGVGAGLTLLPVVPGWGGGLLALGVAIWVVPEQWLAGARTYGASLVSASESRSLSSFTSLLSSSTSVFSWATSVLSWATSPSNAVRRASMETNMELIDFAKGAK